MKKGIWWLSFFVFLGFILLTRDQLLTKALEVYLNHKIESKGWKCAQIVRTKNSLNIQKLHYQSSSEDVLIEGANLSLHLSLFPLQLQPIVNLSHVSIKLSPDPANDTSFLSFLLCTGDSRLDFQLKIENGEIEGLFKQPVSFSFQPSLAKGGLGTFSMQDAEKHPMFSSYLHWEQGSLVSEIEIQEGNISDLSTIVSWISPSSFVKSSQLEGNLTAFLRSRFHPKRGLEGMEGKIDLQNLHILHADLGMDVFSRSLQGTLVLTSNDWKKAEFFITFEDAFYYFEQKGYKVGVQNALGEIRIQPEQDPYLRMGGQLLSKGALLPFEVEGKGSVEEGKKSFQMAADFFLKHHSPHLSVQFSQQEKNSSCLEVECQALSEEVFNVLQLSFPLFHFPSCQMKDGQIEGKCIASFQEGKMQSLKFSKCSTSDLSFSLPDRNLDFSLKNATFSGAITQNVKGGIEISSLDATVDTAELFAQQTEKLRLLSASIKIDAGELVTSSLEGFYQGLYGKIEVLEPGKDEVLHIEGKAFSSDLNSYFGYKTLEKGCPLHVALDVSAKDSSLQGKGAFSLFPSPGKKEEIAFQVSLDKTLSRKVRDLLLPWDFSSCKGFFSAQEISAETMNVLAKPYLGALTLEGFARGEGSFDSKNLFIDLLQANIRVLGGSWDIHAEMGNHEKIGQISYAYREDLWKGKLPLDLLHVHNKEFAFDAKVRDTLFFFEGEELWTDSLQSEILGTKVLGSAFLHPKAVYFASQAWQGDLVSLNPFLTRYAPKMASLGISGSFSIQERGCAFEGKKENGQWKWDWKAAIDLAELSCDLGSFGKVAKGVCSLQGNSQGDFVLKEVQGMYSLPSASCFFSLADIHWNSSFSNPVDFYLRAKDRKREWISLKGKIEKQPEGIALSFLSYGHVLGVPMQILPIGISSQGTISPIYITSTLHLKHLPSYLSMWKDMGIPVTSFPFLASCQGTVQIQGALDLALSKWKVALQSPEIFYETEVVGKATAVMSGEKGLVRIESCRIGPWDIQGSLEKLAAEWNIPRVTLEGPKGKYSFQGKYLPTSCQLQIPMFSAALSLPNSGSLSLQGSFEGIYQSESSSLQGSGVSRLSAVFPSPFEMLVEANKEIPFILDSSKGIEMGKSEWSLLSLAKKKQKLGKFSVKTMSYFLADKKFSLREGSLFIAKDAHPVLQAAFPQMKAVTIEQAIDLQTDIDLTPKYRKLTASMKNGSYRIGNTSFDCKQLQCVLEQDQLYASCQTKWQEKPLYMQMQMEMAKQSSLQLVMKEHPESKGISSEWKHSPSGKWVCETVDGIFCGLDLHMKRTLKDKDKQVYACKAKVHFEELSSLFPKEWRAYVKKWGLGNGYTFQGTVALPWEDPLRIASIQGDVVGEKFGLLGKSLDFFQAKVDYTPQKVRVHGLKIEDGQAQLSMKTLDFTLNAEKAWEFSSPILSVKNFAPSAYFKGSKAKGLQVKNLSFYEVKGCLNQLDKFEGRGSLYFASPTKKEFSFWDVPLTLVKDLGLDPGLLTPVMGEADFVLLHGRVYFTSLRNVYSEGKRSQFYLSPTADSAYLSLEGDWHVDLAMKQNVVWKVTEDLILSIRGTLEKPKYSFTSNKNASEGN